MKTRISRISTNLRGLNGLFYTAFFTLVFAAQGQIGLTPRVSPFTNGLSGPITNGATSVMILSNGTPGFTFTNINSTWLPVYRGRGVGIFLSGFTTNLIPTTTTNLTARFDLVTAYSVTTSNSTTWYTNITTTHPLSFSINLNNSTNVTGYTNFPASALDNANYIRLTDLSHGHTNTVWMSNCLWVAFP